MKVALVGAGNMGISWAGAALLSGHEVSIIDNDEAKLTAFRDGQLTDGEELLWRCIDRQSVQLYSDLSAISDADIIFIAVQTPSQHTVSGNSCDFGPLIRLLDALVPELKGEKEQTVLLGSTVFPGAIDEHISPRLKNVPARFAYQPVFLRAGDGVTDYLHPSKIVVGVSNPEQPPETLHQFLQSTTWNSATPSYCTYQEAEFVKLLHNTFMCLKINFANEVGDMCDHYGVDAVRAIELTFKESAEGRLLTLSHMMPGPPFSGTCLPKDSEILRGILEEQKLVTQCMTLATAHEFNDCRIHKLFENLGNFRSIGVIGMAYRPGYNDVRESLAVEFANKVRTLDRATVGAKIHFWDPVFSSMTEQDYMIAARRDPKVEALWPSVVHSLADLLSVSDIIVVNRKLNTADKQFLAAYKEKRVIDLYRNGV